MGERLEKFALSLHPDKTRLIEFGRFAADRRARRGFGMPETFKFLGFTFICGKSRQGRFLLKRKSRGDRMGAKLQEIKEELRLRMHRPSRRRANGWGTSSAATLTTMRCRQTFAHSTPSATTLPTCGGARSGGAVRRTGTTCERMTALDDDFLPKPRILHPWPQARFAVTHPRWEPRADRRARAW